MCRMGLLLVTLFFTAAASAYQPEDNVIPASLQALLEKATSFELLSLSPDDTKEKPKDGFHGWKVLGKTEVKDASVRKNLLTALKQGVAENKGDVARCFNPRHGIRATLDGKATDLVICFECLQVKVFVADKAEKGFLVSRSPQEAFDTVLKNASVPLPEKPKN